MLSLSQVIIFGICFIFFLRIHIQTVVRAGDISDCQLFNIH